ncbi:MAG: signal peptide peptidase SppA [Planctomycetes bacterium]|nr:signal peptide peptidase SppA [Planctomycetota bacterium]
MSAIPPQVTQTTTPPPIIIQQLPPSPFWIGRWFVRLLMIALIFSLLYCVRLNSEYREYFQQDDGVTEQYRSGEQQATDKIAVLEISGTIMPPFTEHFLKAIKHVKEDERVKGVLLAIDSPGGLVADSDQIYRKLVDLGKTKPMFVSMKRIAASGGVYVAMGCGEEGKIYAEPTTWTGSIGVIIPRYDASKLADKFGVAADSLTTGEFKDSLDPLRALTDRERGLWRGILDESLQRFVDIIDKNRKGLDAAKVKELATGQIFTAEQAKANGLIDEIGDEEDALTALKTKLGLTSVRVVDFNYPVSLMSLLLGSVQARDPETQFRKLLEMSVPRAMYFCGNVSALSPLWQAVVEPR